VYNNLHKEEITIRHKKYYQDNKPRLIEESKNFYLENKERIIKRKADYYYNNKEAISIQRHEKRKTNSIEINAKKKIRLTTDIQFKLATRLRKRLSKAIHGSFKNGSFVGDLGCTVPELKLHLEKQFTEGMTWDNWSFRGWHIDHIKPLASFDLNDREQFLKACHYTNLQPMWAHDNISKGCKIL
jgi:hypothetical protein